MNTKHILLIIVLAIIVVVPILIYIPVVVAPDKTATWQVFNGDGFTFEYPQKFGANVWRPYFWPPKAMVVSVDHDPVKTVCPDLQQTGIDGKPIAAQKLNLNNNNFSFYTSGDAGAGSLYSTYCYITEKSQKFYALEFVIQSHIGCYQGGCGAYCGTQYEQECRNFDLNRDVASVIQKMVSTFLYK